jgi:hypothetical protein
MSLNDCLRADGKEKAPRFRQTLRSGFPGLRRHLRLPVGLGESLRPDRALRVVARGVTCGCPWGYLRLPVGLLRVPLPKQFDSVREAEGIIAQALEAANPFVHTLHKYTFEEVGDRRKR